LKYRNELADFRGLDIAQPYIHLLTFQSCAFGLTVPPPWAAVPLRHLTA